MPRININEKDRTSPGTPGGYSNNTVLIAGFSKRNTEDVIKAMEENPALGYILPDDNGIFEFESSADFVKTLDLVAPTIHITDDKTDIMDAKLPVHYGNQMAYELLKMGYPIIYINLGVPYSKDEDGNTIIEAAQKMKKLGIDDTWAIFKDKASYDFRFVSHGLLTSNEFAKSDDLVKFMQRVAKIEELFQAASVKVVRLCELIELEAKGQLDEKEQKDLVDFLKDIPDENNEGKTRKESNEEALLRLKSEAVTEVKKLEKDFVYKNNKYTTAAEAIDYKTQVFNDLVTTYDLAKEAVTKAQDDLKTALKTGADDIFTDTDFEDANTAIAKLAHYKAVVASDGTEDEMDPTSGRGDCIALIEIDEYNYTRSVFEEKDDNGETTQITIAKPEARIVRAINKLMDINADNGKYCACTVPSVVYNMTADERFDGNKKFPGAFHYLACLKNSLGLGFAEWYAAAGYTRGVSSYVIDHTTVKLGEVAIQALEPRNVEDRSAQPKFAVNVIANFRGSYYLWGNRTCHPLGDAKGGNDLVASHFLNIRQLCTTIKKQLYVSCRRFTFDPNSDVLWINFKNSITPMLDRMKADQGIREYKIEKVYTDKKATLKAKIRIVPIEAVEDFLLEVSLEDSLGETAVTIAE